MATTRPARQSPPCPRSDAFQVLEQLCIASNSSWTFCTNSKALSGSRTDWRYVVVLSLRLQWSVVWFHPNYIHGPRRIFSIDHPRYFATVLRY